MNNTVRLIVVAMRLGFQNFCSLLTWEEKLKVKQKKRSLLCAAMFTGARTRVPYMFFNQHFFNQHICIKQPLSETSIGLLLESPILIKKSTTKYIH